MIFKDGREDKHVEQRWARFLTAEESICCYSAGTQLTAIGFVFLPRTNRSHSFHVWYHSIHSKHFPIVLRVHFVLVLEYLLSFLNYRLRNTTATDSDICYSC